MSDDELRRAEDEQFQYSLGVLRKDQARRERAWPALREWLMNLPPSLIYRRPRGRPRDTGVVTLAGLEDATDRMRRNGTRLTYDTLSREASVGRSTLAAWLRDHPGAYDALRVRHGKR